jgi:7,8-dihydroneopterin aldolase/epimerase/oxygenase
MSRIRIVDLEVFYCIGVTDEERAKPQRLLLTVDMTYDFTSAALTDRLERTINYQTIADELLRFGESRNWKLLEKLVTNIADVLMAEHKPQVIVVEAKKFSLPNARYVSVSLSRNRGQ